jgi:hypothetical protein
MTEVKTTIVPALPGHFCIELIPRGQGEPHIRRLPILAWRVVRYVENNEPDFVPAPSPITCLGVAENRQGGWVLIELPDSRLAYSGHDGEFFGNIDEAVEHWKSWQEERRQLQAAKR